jgi:aspartate kinase
MRTVKVCKFGGTSLATADTIKIVASIIKKDLERKYIVVSAPGKRTSDDTKVTDVLYALADDIIHNGTADKFSIVSDRFTAIAEQLGLKLDYKSILNNVLKQMLRVKTVDYIVSRGEYLTALFLADYLGYEFVDSAEFIRFRGRALDRETTRKLTRKALKNRYYVIISGFYGATAFGDIRTFDRGGSDVSGAIVAQAVKAKLYENWTDVDGFFTCDPNIVPNPKLIEDLTYKELRVLSFMGASILQSNTVFQLAKDEIPINVRNTFNESCPGTFIYPTLHADRPRPPITGIAGLKNFTKIVIEKDAMSEIVGFDRKVLSICEKLGINVEHFPSGTDTFSLMIEKKYLLDGKKELLLQLIRKSTKPDHLEVVDNISLIAIVGRNLMANKYNMLKLFSALVNTYITLHMIDYGSNGLYIVIGVDDEDYHYAINAVYQEFIMEDDE